MRKMTPCPAWQELLSAYQDRALPERDSRRVRAHLADCDACRRALAALERDRAQFTETYLAAAADVDLHDDVMRALEDAPAPRPAFRLTPWQWGAAGGTVALVAALLVLAVQLAHGPQQLAHAQRQRAVGELAAARDMDAGLDRLGPVPKTRKDYGKIMHATDDFIHVDKTAAINLLNTPGLESSDTESFQNFLRGPGDLRMSYDVCYLLQVKDALAQARAAQAAIVTQGGFTVDFRYAREDGKRAWASFSGKVPAAQAEAALAALEKLGEVRSLSIAGEDLTEQFRQQLDTQQRLKEHAERLGNIGSRSKPKEALSAENTRNAAKSQADAARAALLGLTTRTELVTLSAEFVERAPRRPITLARVTEVTRGVLNSALLVLVTLAVILLILALIIAPIVGLKAWRRKQRAAQRPAGETP